MLPRDLGNWTHETRESQIRTHCNFPGGRCNRFLADRVEAVGSSQRGQEHRPRRWRLHSACRSCTYSNFAAKREIVSNMRFSLKSFLGVFVALSVGVVALVNASHLWVSALGLVTIALLLTSLLATIQLEGRARARWMGFAIFGWGYFLFVYPAMLGEAVSTPFLDAVGSRLRRTIPIPSPAPSWVRTTASEGGKTVAVVVDPRNVVRVGRQLLCLVFASIGAWVASALHFRQRKK